MGLIPLTFGGQARVIPVINVSLPANYDGGPRGEL